jgi:hypothetical protein
MLTIDDAFRKFKSRLELNDKEQKNASSRHQEIRDHMRSRFDIKDDFLSGSYRRYTKTKPLKDVDIFCVLGKEEAHYRKEHPSRVLVAFEEALVEKYGAEAVSRQRRSATVDFGVFVDTDDKTGYRVVSMDVIPAFEDGENYEIPDGTSGKWIKTNPKIHEQKATNAHQAYDNEWKGLVRMVKYWNNHHGKPIKPSFLLEVMALECLAPPFGGRFDYEFQSMFATLAGRIHDRSRTTCQRHDGCEREESCRGRAPTSGPSVHAGYRPSAPREERRRTESVAESLRSEVSTLLINRFE